ncbi:MAG: SRPBCC family protein [Candidatus Hydrogenedentes bacterium]|nr:SRPBCC family protein [Candidatus Hydrogenedentota bacterium]
MHLYTLHREQWVPQPLSEVFPFFASPENLQAMTPSNFDMRILTPEPLRMAQGALFDYVVTLWGLPWRWTTLIAAYEPPYRFVDVQLRGPYSYWRHTHRFEECDEGVTIIDTVCYGLPFGPLGRAMHALSVGRQLDAIFRHRHAHVESRWGRASGPVATA